jgi:hypothetical protein
MFGIEVPGWAIGVGIIILAGSLGGAIRRLIAGEPGPPRPPKGKVPRRELGQMMEHLEGKLGEVDELRSRLSELEDVQRRLGELEEPVDFAERLLTKPRDTERVLPPKS